MILVEFHQRRQRRNNEDGKENAGRNYGVTAAMRNTTGVTQAGLGPRWSSVHRGRARLTWTGAVSTEDGPGWSWLKNEWEAKKWTQYKTKGSAVKRGQKSRSQLTGDVGSEKESFSLKMGEHFLSLHKTGMRQWRKTVTWEGAARQQGSGEDAAELKQAGRTRAPRVQRRALSSFT